MFGENTTDLHTCNVLNILFARAICSIRGKCVIKVFIQWEEKDALKTFSLLLRDSVKVGFTTLSWINKTQMHISAYFKRKSNIKKPIVIRNRTKGTLSFTTFSKFTLYTGIVIPLFKTLGLCNYYLSVTKPLTVTEFLSSNQTIIYIHFYGYDLMTCSFESTLFPLMLITAQNPRIFSLSIFGLQIITPILVLVIFCSTSNAFIEVSC